MLSLAGSSATHHRVSWLNPWTWSATRLWVVGLIYLGLLGLGLQILYVTLGINFHTVLRGDVYRSAQLSTSRLETVVREYQIHTIINLRGDNKDTWYLEEHDLGQRLGARVVDVGLWANEPPPPDQFVLLVDTLHAAPAGILVHCNSGGDRSGLASCLALLLRTDTDLAQASRQLHIYYGHNPFGKAACQQRVINAYANWLADNGWHHSPERLLSWARTAYDPAVCR